MLKTRTKIFSITSGKGGVGKTSILSNLAYTLAKKGKKVLIFDGDLGMANVDIMFGKRAPHNVLDLLKDRYLIEDILFRLYQNLYLISGGSALPELQMLNPYERKCILDQLGELEGIFDYVFIDTSPGIDENVRHLNAMAGEILLIVTPEPASLTDSYALIKVLHQMQNKKEFSIVCNQTKDERDALALFSRLQSVCDQFLNIKLSYTGCISRDPLFSQATRRQEVLVETYPEAKSSQEILHLSRKLTGLNTEMGWKSSIEAFVQSPDWLDL